MRATTNMLKIDGVPLLPPTDAPEITFADMESDDSGADESGVYHNEILRTDVLSCKLTYALLTREEYAYIMALLTGKAGFAFTCPGPTGTPTVRQCHVKQKSMALCSADGSLWRGLQFTVQEF